MSRFQSIAWCAALLLLLSAGTRAAEEEGFDAIDRMLEENFQEIDLTLEQQYELLDKAMEDAYQRLATEVKAQWGANDVRLPSKTEWVDYSDDLSFRRSIDFENGVIKLERLVKLGDRVDKVVSDMQKAATAVRQDTLADLSGHDLAMRYAREALEKEGIEVSAAPPRDANTKPVLAEIDQLVPGDAAIGELVQGALAGTPQASATQSGKDASASVAQVAPGKQKVEIRIPFAPGFQQSLAQRYQETVLREAHRQNVKPSLLFAVMETESSFNPRATSAVPAFGLMQLVPSSGAMDAYAFVYGEKTLLDPEYLYQPEKNVELGSAYLNILLTRYLRAIENMESRRYCAIAAYNTGAGNVARTFASGTSVNAAAEVINSMAPQQVLSYLEENLPFEETRRYVEKVTRAQEKYRAFDQPFNT